MFWVPNFMKIGAHFNFGTKFAWIYNFGSRSSISSNIIIISMFDLFWVPNFIKIGHVAILRPNLPKCLISGQGPKFQISYLWLLDLLLLLKFHSIGNIFHFWVLNFPGSRGLILVLLSNVCYLAVILIFLVVTWCLLLFT